MFVFVVTRHSALDDSRVWMCKTRWCYMDVENQKHMLLWSRLEDVVQMLHRMYSFFLTSFPDSFVDDFEEWEKKKSDTGRWDTSDFPRKDPDGDWHHDPKLSVLIQFWQWWKKNALVT